MKIFLKSCSLKRRDLKVASFYEKIYNSFDSITSDIKSTLWFQNVQVWAVCNKANMLQHCKVCKVNNPVSEIDATFESSLDLYDLVLGRLKLYISSFFILQKQL